jgi:hypothetical protein
MRLANPLRGHAAPLQAEPACRRARRSILLWTAGGMVVSALALIALGTRGEAIATRLGLPIAAQSADAR